MRRSYCLSIIRDHSAAVIEAARSSLGDYHYVEVWLDYVQDWDEEFVTTLADELRERLVVLFRRQNLEAMKTSLERRASVMRLLHNRPCLLDLDMSTQKNDLDYARENGLRLQTIVSYHNYAETPEDGRLAEIVDAMREYRPTIYKISTLCNSEEDAVRLLRLLLRLKREGKRHIVLGMGAHGLATRILGPLWGNEMAFAPRELAEQSAPGQLTRAQMETIFAAMGV